MTKDPLNIGIVCFPSIGGSGVVAAESGLHLARRGHTVHFFCHGLPQRLAGTEERIFVHEVRTLEYTVFPDSQYDIALASKIISECAERKLDVLHVHYAIPHATSAYLAKQALGVTRPWVVTTLHGTDITLVGRDPSFLPMVRFSIMQSDVVVTPSKYLREATFEILGICREKEILVVPNFVDEVLYQPSPLPKCSQVKTLTHVSNFRPVKRIEDVVKIFAKVRQKLAVRLVLVGDGPERPKIEQLVKTLGLQADVCFLGARADFVGILQRSDLFLLPSAEESFGLAALEAMSCGVPVIASRTGGIPEVVSHGVNGMLADIGDVETMASYAIELLLDESRLEQFSDAARAAVLDHFRAESLVPEYEEIYYSLRDAS